MILLQVANHVMNADTSLSDTSVVANNKPHYELYNLGHERVLHSDVSRMGV